MSNRKLTVLGLVGLALAAGSAAIALANSAAPHRGVSATVAALTVAALLGVGLYAWRRGGEGRFGQVLFATGLSFFVASFSNSDVGLLYSIGRIAAWVFEIALVYALLSYPNGHLETRASRLILVAGVALVAVLYLPTVPFVGQYPLPTPFAGCTDQCPSNTFYVGSEPGLIEGVVRPLREVLTVLVYLSVLALLSLRLSAASRNLRRSLAPVLGAAVLRFAAASVYVALRRADVKAGVLDVASTVALLTVPATALGLLVGLLQWRVYSGGALATLTTGLGATRTPAEMQTLLAGSLAEPALALYYAPANSGEGRQRWHDAGGSTCAAPAAGPRSCVAEAAADSGLRVGFVCDRGFRDYPDFLAAVSACVISGLERQRLDAELEASLADVAASRKRLAGAADGARRKIERDLHDGAQQQLVALRVKLELAREALEADPGDAAALVGALAPEVDEIIEEVRSLAHGIYPPLLASAGLGEALRAAARRSPLPVSVESDGVGRFAPEIESAVYFCCLEALQNAAKHATGASRVAIELSRAEGLRFQVTDDGCGFAAAAVANGGGITGMRDRLAAVGGSVRVESDVGTGTTVVGHVGVD